MIVFTLLAATTQAALSPDDAQFILNAGQAANDSLLWGTYRPNLYFGTRPRLPESLMTGLIWFDGSHFQGFQRLYTRKNKERNDISSRGREFLKRGTPCMRSR